MNGPPLVAGAAQEAAQARHDLADAAHEEVPASVTRARVGRRTRGGAGLASDIEDSGVPGGAISDRAAHASTLVSIFCIPPSFNAGVDLGFDWPGPAAVSLPGTAQLLP